MNTTAARESINTFRFKTYEYNNVGINYAALDLTNICKKAADIAMIPCRRHKAKGKKKKRGTIFDKTCAIVEKEIKLLCQRINENPFDKQLKQKYYAKKKERRKLLKHNSKIMKQKMVSQLNQLHDENPREYWNIVNKLEELHTDKENPVDKISPEKWFCHFKGLMYKENGLSEDHMDMKRKLQNHASKNNFSPLDFRITTDEILKGISKLKKDKSPGKDSVTNNMIKAGQYELVPVLAKVFNMILLSGQFPDTWASGIIKPLFKGGSMYDPSDYRRITLSSCFGKLFCSLLNKRLVNFLNDNEIYKPNQIAFREGNRTSDHIFVIKTLIDKYIKNCCSNKPRTLFVCFVDLRKAFDTVWRDALLFKMLELGIGGNFYNVIENLYGKSRASVKLNQGLKAHRQFPKRTFHHQ